MAKKIKYSSPKKPPFIFGFHAVKAALLNPRRQCHGLWLTTDMLTLLQSESLLVARPTLKIELTDIPALNLKAGDYNTHQGIILHADPLPRLHLEDMLAATLSERAVVVVLDQISDPHNVGAVLRSAAAFGAVAVIQPEDHTPDPASPVIAKVASGALEHIPLISVTNLARALMMLKEDGFWLIGLDEKGAQSLNEVKIEGRIALVMGSEEKGMRRLTRENCDILASLPTSPGFPTLNVSNAAAVSLYEFARRR